MAYDTVTLTDVINRLDTLTRAVLANKTTMTTDECAAYIGLSKSELYKLTSARDIPFYKPRGKMIYFDRAEIDEWLRQNRIKTNQEIEQAAANHLVGGKAV